MQKERNLGPVVCRSKKKRTESWNRSNTGSLIQNTGSLIQDPKFRKICLKIHTLNWTLREGFVSVLINNGWDPHICEECAWKKYL